MEKVDSNRNLATERKRVESLFLPMVLLLRMSGLTRETLEKGLASAYKRASKSIKGRKIKHIADSTRYADVVSCWTHDKRFLDAKGRPRLLKLNGEKGFTTLVRHAAPNADLIDVLTVLKRFKTISRTKGGEYKLLKPFFISATKESVAIEPVARFLNDATTTLSKILIRTKNSSKPDVFWRNVDNPKLSMATAKKFLDFTRERSLTFLEELDDWLEAHSERDTTSVKTRHHRVGLGIFSIHSGSRP